MKVVPDCQQGGRSFIRHHRESFSLCPSVIWNEQLFTEIITGDDGLKENQPGSFLYLVKKIS
jgi:hypothetical protein